MQGEIELDVTKAALDRVFELLLDTNDYEDLIETRQERNDLRMKPKKNGEKVSLDVYSVIESLLTSHREEQYDMIQWAVSAYTTKLVNCSQR